MPNREEGTNLVLIDPDLHDLVPDSESVNGALRDYVEQHKRSATLHGAVGVC